MKTIFTRIVTLFVTLAAVAVADEITQQQANEAFQRLLKVGQQSYEQSLDGVASGAKVRIADEVSVTVDGTSYQTGMKVYFQLANGNFVNPSLHRWNPQEKFKIFVVAPVAGYFVLIQNYPEDRPPTRQVYPDTKYPATFTVIPPGKLFELPVKFETDKDLRKETLVLTFARIDEPAIGESVAVTATRETTATVTETTTATITETETLQARVDRAPARPQNTLTGGVLMRPKNVTQTIDYLNKESNSKIRIVEPETAESNNRDDVAVIVLGEGKTAQFQLTLNK
ncbi:MAG: hypothetical protein LBC20_12685 [Planctomycetaceae bacterium]|jgi:hypothetical protein|nr:hypothetical protein [Planctomycetaceae bacterium]